MAAIRTPVVAGTFYPASAQQLRTMRAEYLNAAHAFSPPPKAIITPHAGYIYPGPIAASAYVHLTDSIFWHHPACRSAWTSALGDHRGARSEPCGSLFSEKNPGE